jgi:amidase
MGRTVADVALLLSVMAGPDARVPISLDEPGEMFRTASLETELGSLRVAFAPRADQRMPFEPAVVDVVARHADTFERLGWDVEDAFPDLAGAREAFFTLRARGYADELGDLVATDRERVKATVVWNVEAGLALTDDDVTRARERLRAIRARTAAFFERFDVLAMPVTQVVPFPAETEYPTEIEGTSMSTYLDWMESCWSITVTGSPAISVPAGFTDDGLPVGLQLVGPPRADLALLRIAHAFETATGHWRRPPSGPREE